MHKQQEKIKKISFFTPCFNEVENVASLHSEVAKQASNLGYDYEHIFIDNASKDGTDRALEELAAANKNVKVIFNTRNFGHVRSPYYGMMECGGDAILLLSADFQDPPSLIPTLVKEWEAGNLIVLGQKTKTQDGLLMSMLRNLFYFAISMISDVEQLPRTTGFGIYDRYALEIIRNFEEPYPYFRGLILEAGLPVKLIPFEKPKRKAGKSKNNFMSLYDLAMTGFVNHSLAPLRLITLTGFFLSVLCFMLSLAYFIKKLVFWESLASGVGVILVAGFFLAGVLLFAIGILGEYIGVIHTNVRNHPHVVERTRINFSPDDRPVERADSLTSTINEDQPDSTT